MSAGRGGASPAPSFPSTDLYSYFLSLFGRMSYFSLYKFPCHTFRFAEPLVQRAILSLEVTSLKTSIHYFRYTKYFTEKLSETEVLECWERSYFKVLVAK